MPIDTIAASVADAALLAEAMAGPDPADPGSLGCDAPDWRAALVGEARGLRVGVCRTHFFDNLVTDVGDCVEAAISALGRAGAEIVEFELPEIGEGLGAIFAIELASSTNYHDRRLREGTVRRFEPDVRLLVEMGRMVSGADYLQAERFRRHLAERLAPVFERVDVIAGPTMPLTAWHSGERECAHHGHPTADSMNIRPGFPRTSDHPFQQHPTGGV